MMVNKRRFSICIGIVLLLFTGIKVKAENDIYKNEMKQDILCLMLAYPEYIIGIEKNDKGFVFIKMKSGNKILYDDKRVKGEEEKLNNPDLQDTMKQLYPLDFPKGLMPANFDPGRYRSYKLLSEVYGSSAAQVQKNLTNVKTVSGYLQFNTNNNAASELSTVMKELAPLAKARADVRAVLYPLSGTFNYRYISGTSRLSPHAFATAIDLASNKNDYWKWSPAKEGEKRLLSYPKALVEVFEGHNFIWGGKWNHFDILHFEYRPEIMLKARYFGKAYAAKEWHGNLDIDKNIEAKINMIDKVID